MLGKGKVWVIILYFLKFHNTVNFICINISKACQTDGVSEAVSLCIIDSILLLPREAILPFYFLLNFMLIKKGEWSSTVQNQINVSSAFVENAKTRGQRWISLIQKLITLWSELSCLCLHVMCLGGANVDRCSEGFLPPLPKWLRCWWRFINRDPDFIRFNYQEWLGKTESSLVRNTFNWWMQNWQHWKWGFWERQKKKKHGKMNTQFHFL